MRPTTRPGGQSARQPRKSPARCWLPTTTMPPPIALYKMNARNSNPNPAITISAFLQIPGTVRSSGTE